MTRVLAAIFLGFPLTGGVSADEISKVSEVPAPASPENPVLHALIEAVYPSELTSESVRDNSAKTVNALRVSLRNESDTPVQLLWGDFMVRINNGPWIGSWWEPGLDTPGKLHKILGTDTSLPSPRLAPRQSVQFVLTDPWISEQDVMEYKFQVLVMGSTGEVLQSSSAATLGVPVDVETPGVLRAVAGISSAIRGLFPNTPPDHKPKPGEFGVSIEHKVIGPVEAEKNSALQQSLTSWREADPTNSLRNIYAYQTEVINNTNLPLRLVQLELSLAYEANWLSGTLRPAVFSEEKIIKSGYLQTLGEEGEPKLVKMGNAWIPPGARAVFPANWHPQEANDKPTAARWRAILTPAEGAVVFAEGEVNKLMPALILSDPAPSQ